jgi:hypothetical protein
MSVTRVSGIPRRVLEILGFYDELLTSSAYAGDRPPIPPKVS